MLRRVWARWFGERDERALSLAQASSAQRSSVSDSTADDRASVAVGPPDGELDLHAFRARETAELVREYVLACQAKGVVGLRIVHGKGKGVLRRSGHAVLADMPDVVLRYRLAEPQRGGWGATLVDLRPR